MWHLLKQSPLAMPEPGWSFRDEESHPGRIDLAYPAHRLAIECNGWKFHGPDRDKWERDSVRVSRLAALDWRVMFVTWRQLEHDPALVIDRIARALDPARRIGRPPGRPSRRRAR
jgi:very-short-patch-repair endonuclease